MDSSTSYEFNAALSSRTRKISTQLRGMTPALAATAHDSKSTASFTVPPPPAIVYVFPEPDWP